jgi:hypothetical protein
VSLISASGELGQGLKVAREVWEDTRAVWKDAVAEDFEKRHWTPMADQVAAVTDAIDRLAPILARMYRDCT